MSDRAPDAVLWNLFWGALGTRALGVVADLRIADALASGPREINDLAREVGADADALRRILRGLASEGVFAEEERGVFRNTAASVLLRRSGVDDFAHLFGSAWHRAAGELDATGEPVFARTFGMDFWAWLAEHPDERGAFDRAMAQSLEMKLERLERVEWRGDETVVDIGGGNGAVLVELVQRHSGLRGIVFDLPETVRNEETFGDRCRFVAGDFFERVPRGDVYVLSTILHDWDDERASAILRTIRAAAPDDARVIVMDAVIPTGNERHGPKWLDLLMLVLFAGRERDEEQWRELLDGAGFEPVQIEDGLIQARCG
ncbi:MAG TPA: methyltransferase [Candidatus Limnocylindria bacterium]